MPHDLPDLQPAPPHPGAGTVLTIAGFDPSSGAGITADLKTFAAHGRFGTACITALTVQSTQGVFAVDPVSPTNLQATLDRLEDDLPPAGVKIGMLGTADSLVSVALWLESVLRRRPIPVVLDPVLRSSSGAALLDPTVLDLLRSRLFPLCTVLTPNRAELLALSPSSDLLSSAHLLREQIGGHQLVVTGGDDPSPTDRVFLPDGSLHHVHGTHIVSRATHGTGCAFSSALLCHLLAGETLLASARHAKHFVEQGIQRAPQLGRGRGPLDLLWPLKP